MSKMSDLDLLVRSGERTADDFEKRGFSKEDARAMASLVESGEDDILGDFDENGDAYERPALKPPAPKPPGYLPARHPHRRK